MFFFSWFAVILWPKNDPTIKAALTLEGSLDFFFFKNSGCICVQQGLCRLGTGSWALVNLLERFQVATMQIANLTLKVK